MTDKLKFAHLADLHLGSYREKKLTELNFKSFQIAIDKIIENKCDYVLFCGDIFNNSMPDLVLLDNFITEIKKLKKNKIPVYVIGGSHDYSNNQKSFLDLLNNIEFIKTIKNIKKTDYNEYELNFIKNEKLKICLTGIIGRKNNIEKKIYKSLKKPRLDNSYFNIFMFHTSIDNLKPKDMNFSSQINTNNLPEGFDYYAGGHIHKNIISKYKGKPISYPGCLFPNNFKELIEEEPSFNLCEFNFKNRELKIKKINIKTYEKVFLDINVEDMNPIEANNTIYKKLEKQDLKDKLVLMKIRGIIKGKIIDMKINEIIDYIYQKGVKTVLKNTHQLKSNLVQVNINTSSTTQEIEDDLINNILEDKNDVQKTKKLLNIDLKKYEEEKNTDYEKRVIKLIDTVL